MQLGRIAVSLVSVAFLACSSQLGEGELDQARSAMVLRLEQSGKVTDPTVLKAMETVDRHRFLHGRQWPLAYLDRALKILDPRLPAGYEQSISSPSMIGKMLQLASPRPFDRVLDLRTGAGYQTAILARLAKEVFTVEVIPGVGVAAKKRLEAMGFQNIHFRLGDLYEGWEEKGPFDVILATAAPDHIPQNLVDQLAPGGRMVLPVGDLIQHLFLIEKNASGGVIQRRQGKVRFIPMLRQEDIQNMPVR